MRDIDHVLLTRFNLPTRGVESTIRAKEGWLRDRVALFERYCLPSVSSQTSKDFRWIIYFDPQSPDWLMEKIETLSASGIFVPIFRESVSPAELVSDLRETTHALRSHLITTNLDNDDGLAADFVERIQSIPVSAEHTALYLGRGIIKSASGLYRRRDPHNAFCSVRENWTDPQTCWVDWHDLLPRHMEAKSIGGAPGWLQVIHGTNVSNRVRGTRTVRGALPSLFPGLIEDVDDPNRSELLRARLVVEPARAVREGVRLTAKRAARAVLGKEGLDRVKSALAGSRGSSE
jgi:hypothetical protein